MTNNKINFPFYAEEQIINQEETLNEQKTIPQDFVELTAYGKSHSTEELGLPKEPCWRYNFAYENRKKWIIVDIPCKLTEKLNPKLNENCPYSVFISLKVLKRETECGGITLQSEEEIFFVPQKSRLVREKEIQTNLSGEGIEEMIKKLEGLETKLSEAEKLKSIWRNKYLEEKGDNNQEFQAQITELTIERDNIQQKLNDKINNLQNEANQLNTNLTTTQQERDQLQQNLNNLEEKLKRVQKNFLGSIFRSGKKSKEIKDLEVRMARLRVQLFDKNQKITDLRNIVNTRNQTITDLNTQINKLTNRINDLKQQLTTANNLITNVQNLLGINNFNVLSPLLQGETLTSLLERPTQEELEQKEEIMRGYLERISELEREKEQLDNEWKDRFQQQENKANNLQAELTKEQGWWDKWKNATSEEESRKELKISRKFLKYSPWEYFAIRLQKGSSGSDYRIAPRNITSNWDSWGADKKVLFVNTIQVFYKYYKEK